MKHRNAKQRQQKIIHLLNEVKQVTITELASLFDASEVTIRKDLSALERNGVLVRHHGGATLLPSNLANNAINKNALQQAIAKKAASLVRNNSRIIIDSGSTTTCFTQQLGTIKGLIVMTNSIAVASALNALKNDKTLLMTGGTWDARSESLQGKIAKQSLLAYDFDQLFISADGVDLERGATTFNETIELSQTMASVARQVILMAESKKFSKKMPNLELSWQQIDVVITDDQLPEPAKQKMLSYGIDVIFTSAIE